MTSFLRLVCASALVACSGSSFGGSVQGTIHGTGFAIQDAISASVAVSTTFGMQHAAGVAMASTSGLCTDAAGYVEHPNQKVVILSMYDVTGLTANTPTAPGTYTIYQGSGTSPPKSAAWSSRVLDATCKDIAASDAKATTGTVTLSSINGNVFTGSYDVVLDSGDHVTGSFDPEACPALQTAISATTTPTCI